MSALRVAIVTALALARPAFADVSAADEAFKKGRELLKAGKFAEACEQFERSQALDPALGTQFNIAQCDEHIGKLASALAAYREVVSKDTKPERRELANDGVTRLEPRVPKLLVKVPLSAHGVAMTVDGKPQQPNRAIEVDNGTHDVQVHADGMEVFTAKPAISEEGKTVTVEAKFVPAPEREKLPPRPKRGEPTAPKHEEVVETNGSSRKLIGIGVAGAGVAGIATGAVFGILARGKWNDAKAVCGGMTCATQADADRANSLGSQARSKATISTVAFAAGGVLAAAGVVLWLTAPAEHAVAVTASASSDGGSVVVFGRF